MLHEHLAGAAPQARGGGLGAGMTFFFCAMQRWCRVLWRRHGIGCMFSQPPLSLARDVCRRPSGGAWGTPCSRPPLPTAQLRIEPPRHALRPCCASEPQALRPTRHCILPAAWIRWVIQLPHVWLLKAPAVAQKCCCCPHRIHQGTVTPIFSAYPGARVSASHGFWSQSLNARRQHPVYPTCTRQRIKPSTNAAPLAFLSFRCDAAYHLQRC